MTQRLFTLPDETFVYPGHDYQGHIVSTIGEERRWNPRFVERESREPVARLRPTEMLRDGASFIELMTNLDLPKPKKMMEAVPANKRCGNVGSLG